MILKRWHSPGDVNGSREMDHVHTLFDERCGNEGGLTTRCTGPGMRGDLILSDYFPGQ
jgi:hypothetical protein